MKTFKKKDKVKIRSVNKQMELLEDRLGKICEVTDVWDGVIELSEVETGELLYCEDYNIELVEEQIFKVGDIVVPICARKFLKEKKFLFETGVVRNVSSNGKIVVGSTCLFWIMAGKARKYNSINIAIDKHLLTLKEPAKTT